MCSCEYMNLQLLLWLLSYGSYHISPQVDTVGGGSKSLKLGDFGLAVKCDGPLFTVCGTPTYVAPEILAETGSALVINSVAIPSPCHDF